MKLVLNGYNNIMTKVNSLVGSFLGVLLGIMTILIMWQVFARFVVGTPLTFSEEIARFIMIWLTMLGSAYAFRKGTLISIDVLVEFGNEKIVKFLNILIPVISMFFAVILIVYGFELVDRVSTQIAPSTRISMAIPVLAVPISGILVILNAFCLIIDQVIGDKGGEEV